MSSAAEDLNWIQLEESLKAAVKQLESSSSPNAPPRLTLKASHAKRHEALESLQQLRSQIEQHPALFELRGVPATELGLFLKTPALWADHHLKTLERRSEWVAGRLAVFDCLHDAPKSSDRPNFYSSVSHSNGAILACGGFTSAPLGIDVESSSRKISAAAKARVFSEQEQKLGLNSIELWTIKEASFKALQLPSPSTLSDIVVETAHTIPFGKTGTAGLTRTRGQTCSFWTYHHWDWTLSLAQMNLRV